VSRRFGEWIESICCRRCIGQLEGRGVMVAVGVSPIFHLAFVSFILLVTRQPNMTTEFA